MHTYRSLYRLASTETEGVAAARASHAASPAELYWKIALPTSPMPGAIRDLINPARSASQEDTDMDEVSTDAVFFLEKDLFPGSKITLHFTRGGACAMVLLRGRADAIPFASEKLPEILTQLSVPAGSRAAEDMRTTLADSPPASLGTRDIRAVSTEVIGTGAAETPRQEYTVEALKPVVSVSGGNMVTCHGMPYAYAVFGCHTTTATAYAVTLAGADGTRAEALATCHGDAFPGVAEAYERVGVAAGSVPVCHIMPLGDMLWVRN
ncbi:hypothetical protein OsJ_17592 [Oryza sativa Japonica Group]|uniref:BURP domain-containing protein n=1 Tax=Oryza sativa subsp. japonica TaxID=39947 RepID=B9FJ35_ORYSJ|nr:hypothetical protein OsJ_17592 [Oryza sativa Japonica Group]